VKSIRLQFVLGAELSSRLIAWYGNGYGGFSHVDAVMPDGSLLGARSDRVKAKGAEYEPGVQIRLPGYASWIKKEVYQLEVSPFVAKAWEARGRSLIGSQYDKGAIWGFITGHQDHDKGHWICSALQVDMLQTAGIFQRIDIPSWQVTPNSLLLALTALGAKRTEC
jgi:hypothetical protein